MPSSVPTSFGMLNFSTEELSSTILAVLPKVSAVVILNVFLIRPKHQSGANLACPAIRKQQVKFGCSAPGTVPKHEIIFVLATAVVPAQVYVCFYSCKVLEKVRYVANDCIATFPTCHPFIDAIVYLSWHPLTNDTKRPHLHGVKKYMGPSCIGFEG